MLLLLLLLLLVLLLLLLFYIYFFIILFSPISAKPVGLKIKLGYHYYYYYYYYYFYFDYINIIGPINEAGHSFLSELGRRLSTISDDPSESFFLFQRISILIQGFNEVTVRGTFDAETGHDE